jgi:hypothetical protein
MTGDFTISEAWQRGETAAKEQIAAMKTKPTVPVSRTWAAQSILASPHVLNWPVDVREWLFDQATTQPKSPTQHPHHALSRSDLGLAEK